MILELNLQFFGEDGPGGEKTEEPTAKKKSDTRKDGKVAKSKELSNAVQVIALFLIIKFWIGSMGEGFIELFGDVYEKFGAYTTYWGGRIIAEEYHILFSDIYIEILKLVAPYFIIGLVIAIGINMMQFQFKITTKPLKPKLSKFNPISGFKRIFSASKLVDLLK